MTILLDRDVVPGRGYRRVVTFRDGRTLTFGPIAGAAGPTPDEFALISVGPSPSGGAVRVEFVVARGSPARSPAREV